MNILHISSARTWRGGERQVKLLIEGLTRKGMESFLMTPDKSALSRRSGLEVKQIVKFRKGAFSLIRNIISLKRYCDEHQIDIIHGHDSHAHTLIWMALRLTGLKTKFLVTRRLINPIKSRSLKKYNYSKIEKIICISNAVREVMAPSITNPLRLEVIHSGIDLDSIQANNDEIAVKKEFIIGYVAAFTEEKDHSTFVAVAENLINKYPDYSYSFLMVGDGPLMEKVKRSTEHMNGLFIFKGFVKDISKEYSEIDILLHPSKSEALGTAILDAMKYNIPIVATKIGGIPEIIDHNQNGYLCAIGDVEDMAEKIHSLIKDRELRQQFVQNARLKLKNFDKNVMVNKTVDLYHRLME